jgi:geranylgeranyl diphosphate synthase type I
MIEGQYLDICFESRLEITVDDYLDMISRKTGALIGCSLELGALFGGASDTSIDCFHNCGYKLGLAFQIRDDMLGVWGDPKLTGKPLGSDIRRKKKSMPVVYVFQHAKGSQRTELEDIYKNKEIGDADTDRVLSIMKDLGSEEYAWKMARRFREDALADIQSVSLAQSDRQLFLEVADFLVERNY